MQQQPEKPSENKIENSKNVIQDSNIQGQNIHIGDVHYHGAQESKLSTDSLETFEKIRQLIIHNRMDAAFKALNDIAKTLDKDLADGIYMLHNQWKDLKNKENMGFISYGEATIRRNQLVNSLLQTIRDLEENQIP
ncbi:MAG TPA: hypothetical protein PKA00_03275 [Saprospiraceae bacterium]|nr:hypothetical protein [Saprospiraceae bacterium]HMQ81897.1 hypothetical protein [Saprospiraceae bacterium]